MKLPDFIFSHKWQKIALSVLCVTLSLVLIAMIFVTAYVNSILNRVAGSAGSMDTQGTMSHAQIESMLATQETEEIEPPDPSSTYATVGEDFTLPTLPPVTEPPFQSDEVINILLIGQDRRPGEGRQRSDSMILCSVNTKNNTVTMTSFLRDLYVEIPGYWADRLNAAYQWGGMPCLDEALAVNFGVHVDANVEIDFDGFIKMIDILGGVDITLNQKEADYINAQNKSWTLKEGLNHLNADQALAYCRARKVDAKGDAGRAARQRTVISALIQKYKEQNILTIMSLVNEIIPLVKTDMTRDEIIFYAKAFFPMLSTCTLQSQQIPASGTYQGVVIRGMQVKVPDLVKNREILRNILYPSA